MVAGPYSGGRERGWWGHGKAAGKATEGSAHQRWGRQCRHNGNPAGLVLLQCRRLDEETGGVRGGRPCSRREGNGGGSEKEGTGGGGTHFKGVWWRGAKGARVAPRGEEVGHGGQHCGRVAQSASNGSRPVGAGTAAQTCHMAGPNRGGRWLTGGSGATVMGGGGQTV
jgi:hypothetical protein